MKNILILIGLVFFPLLATHAAVAYQLPGMTICEQKSGCAVEIDGDGYLKSTESHEKIFDLPFRKTIFDSYSMVKIGSHYIIERSNTTSSRNWDLLLLTYASGVVSAERVIFLSKGFDTKSQETYWGGYECRGHAPMDRKYSPFDAATKVLCDGIQKMDSLELATTVINDTAKRKGLVVNIPLYGVASKKNVVYFFPNTNEPDAGSLLCLQNCRYENNDFRQYGGWIGKKFWIDCVLHTLENSTVLTGSYFYIGKKERINLAGNYVNGKIDLYESFKTEIGARKIRATFHGNGSSDAVVGKWHSIESGETYDFLFASRVF